MKNLSRFALSLTSLLVVTLMLAVPAHARVGQVLYSIGNVTVEKPAISSLRRRDTVDEGDVIVTGDKSYAQIKLDDGTKIAIRSNSRFVIEAFEAPATATTPAVGLGSRLTARFNLQRGGFRTITGRITRRDPSVYQLTTPSAVIRVRGTNYVVRICDADCGPSVDGLYVGVSDGDISMNNAGGDLDLGKNQFGYAANFNTAPMRLTAPPSGLQDDGLALLEEEEEEESSDEESSDESSEESSDESSDDDSSEESSDGSSDESTEEMVADRGGEVSTEAASTASATTTDTTTTVEEVDQTISDASGGDLTDGQSSPRGLSFTVGSLAADINANISEITSDDGGNLTGFTDPGSSLDSGLGGAIYDIGTAVNSNVGFDPTSGLRWGRWSIGVATQTNDGGTSTSINLSDQSLHWITAPEGDAPVQVITGSTSYQLVGNTDPTDNLGNVGVLGSASFSADFTNNTVASSIALSINQSVWNASGTGAITSNLFSGLYNTVTINGDASGSGSFGGIFAGFENGSPVGAGLSYQLTNGSTTVNGSAVFNSTGR
ncbi:MAG: FecR domain-containing protein [Pseudomonadales bacterium]|nr:FecR domain-containing protein [Pseudomonadales bacterium]